MDSAGNLYSATAHGGEYDSGLFFRLSPDGTGTVLHAFSGASDGAETVLLDFAGGSDGMIFAKRVYAGFNMRNKLVSHLLPEAGTYGKNRS
jgi:uncharacterized repeat protein (TIGR03803 family)